MRKPRPISWAKSFSKVASATVTLVGFLVFVGWMFDIAVLKSVLPELVTMKANTALAFLLAGISLWLLQEEQGERHRRRIALGCASLVALVGLLTLIEYLFGWRDGIDQLLFREPPGAVGTFSPGRMAPTTALNFLLLGAALLLVGVASRRGRWAAQFFAVAAAAASLLALIGYAYGSTSFYQIARYTQMALHTSLTFLVLSAGVLAARPDHRLMVILTGNSLGGVMARRLLPAAIVFPAVLGWLGLQGQRSGLYGTEFGLAFFATSNIVVFTYLIWRNARSLHQTDTERKVAERRTAAEHAATRVMAEEESAPAAIRKVLQVVCEALRWEEGAFWTVDESANVLRCVEFWRAPGAPAAEFEKITRTTAFQPGIGLPGRIWATGKPAWIEDVVRDTNFPRAPYAAREGLHGAFGFPITLGGKTIGILEFFSSEIQEPDEQLLTMMGAVGSQLGQFMERKRAEAALRVSQDQFRALFEEAPVAYHEIDREGIVRRVNRAECDLLGFEPEKILGRPVWELVAPEEREVSRESVRMKLSGKRPIGVLQRELVRRDGQRLIVEIHEKLIRDASGATVGIRSALLDITERKRAEAALRENQEKTRLIVDTAQEAFVAMDASGRIIDWNKEAESTFRWPRAEVLGRLLAETIIPPQHREAHRRGLEHFLATGEGPVLNRRLELTALRRDGQEFPVELTIAPVRVGNHWIFNAFLHDISERKRAEVELARARDAALESARLKAEFVANMSHEIRTPLNAIIGMTGLLLDTELSSQQREFADTVRNSGEALLAIINDILDFSKIESGRMTIEKLDFDLRDAIESAVELVAGRAQAKGLELALALDPDVPTALRGDPGRLRQVLTNLLSNAVKFTDRGEVVVRASKENELDDLVVVRLAVKDTGIGLSREGMRRLFQSFTQADASTTRKYGGTGLGLAICRQLVELMHGEIGVESKPGQGATFWCKLPFEKQPAEKLARALARADLAGLSVLVVDDNATNREIVRLQVSSWRMRCDTVAGGAEALAVLRRAACGQNAYHLAILDMQMPEMDGLAVARAIRADEALAPLRVVIMTSLAHALEPQAMEEAGIAAYLTKPVKQSALFDCLATVMGEAKPAPRPPAPPPVALPGRKHFRVLVVEDNAVNQRVALLQLQKLGYEADAVGNGLEALDALSRIPYHLVLMDCQMPEMDGFEATAEIRRREGAGKHTPIVAMTASALGDDRAKCLAVGMDDYISKPVKLEELGEALARWDAPVDRVALAALRGLGGAGDRDTFGTLVGLYLKDTPGHLAALRRAVQEGNAGELKRAAHTLKGSSGSLGARGMQELCMRAEALAETGEVAAAGELADALEEEFARVRSVLEAELQKVQ